MTVSATTRVELVEAMMDLIEAGDREALEEMIDARAHPEIEWMPLIAAGVEGGYHGRDGIRRFLEDVLGSFEVRYPERELRQIGDEVVLALFRMTLRGRESGVETSTRGGTVYEFEGSLIRRGRVYDDPAAAVAAAEELGDAQA